MTGKDLQHGMIDINMTNDKDYAKITKFSKMKFPKFGSIRIKEIIKEDLKIVNEFCGYSIVTKLARFTLKGMF